ncbi:Hypothetical protein NTJ_12308 [Nesidiocoris tenuis]|uniref:G-protein coupled receptors family 1 profile domain-containing protein n=1 Tax=Nesidiocoris tenuis TaxID=355587 RepID=A0ABN7B4Z6_9HEMI|nr:Hypothetical protein NTJ_12308 [Nesidiocoris tenuis]
MGGSHIAGAVMYTSSYKSMISRPVFVAFFIVQALSVIIEVATAVCVMICINYETEYHDVVLVAKMAIGLLLVSFVVLISVIILSLYAHAHHGLAHRFAADSCRDECAKGTDVIAHLFVGCTYEAIAINSCALPVVIYVLKKAVLFVKSEQQERKERYRAAKSRQPQSKRHQGPGHSQGGSTISLVDAVIPEIKL